MDQKVCVAFNFILIFCQIYQAKIFNFLVDGFGNVWDEITVGLVDSLLSNFLSKLKCCVLVIYRFLQKVGRHTKLNYENENRACKQNNIARFTLLTSLEKVGMFHHEPKTQVDHVFLHKELMSFTITLFIIEINLIKVNVPILITCYSF